MSTILYVEDNAQNMRLVRKMLKADGHEMLEALNGMTGIEMTKQHNPDLILMDINLPDIDGMEVTRTIKQNPELADIPIIALTANAMHGDREKFIEAGCDGYLAKPISRRELSNMVSNFLRSK